MRCKLTDNAFGFFLILHNEMTHFLLIIIGRYKFPLKHIDKDKHKNLEF